MPVVKYDSSKLTDVEMEGVKGVSKFVPISPKEGWAGYVLRVFRVQPGGHAPRHQHDWEHVNYVIKGRGRLRIGNEIHELDEKDFAFVPPNTEHQFENPYDDEFEFICIVPEKGEY